MGNVASFYNKNICLEDFGMVSFQRVLMCVSVNIKELYIMWDVCLRLYYNVSKRESRFPIFIAFPK